MAFASVSQRMYWLAGAIWLGVIVLAAWFALTPVGQTLSRSVENWAWQLSVRVIPDQRFVFVDIDERSLAIEGGWPWSRARIADLVEALRASDASEVTLDMMFPDMKTGDPKLAAQLLIDPQSVVAMTFALPGNDQVTTGQLPQGRFEGLCSQNLFPRAIGYVGQASTLNVPAGHVVPRVESDGVLRETPAFVCFEGDAYPALALEAFMRAAGLGDAVRLELSHEPVLVIDESVRIPLTDRGGLRIPYHRDSASFERVSAADVLAGIIDLEGRWVVIGSSAVGLSDRVSTPLAPIEAGAFAHLRLLSTLLDQDFVVHGSTSQILVWIASAVLVAVLLVLSLVRQLRWWIAPVMVVGFGGLLFAMIGMLQGNFLIVVGLVGPLTAVLLGGVVSTGLAFFQYRADQLAMISRLAAYLPMDVAGRIARGTRMGVVDMRAQRGTLMSLDLRNFDRWSEKLDTNLTAALLHHYVTLVSDRVRSSGGQPLQVNGARVRIFWQASVDPERILRAAAELLTDVEQVFPDMEVDQSLPPMALMIGIEAGELLLGTYGSENSRGFTLLGDTARVVQALVRMSTELSAPCVVGPEFASQLSGERLRSLGVFLLEESETPRELFEPLEGAHS